MIVRELIFFLSDRKELSNKTGAGEIVEETNK